MDRTFQDLVEEFDTQLERGSGYDDFWKYVPPVFDHILDEGLHKQALDDMLCKIRDQGMPVTALHTSGQFVALHYSRFSNWALILHSFPSRFLYLSPADALQASVGGSELFVERLGCEQPKSFDVLQPDLELRSEGRAAAPRAKVFARRGRHEILDWSGGSAAKPGLTLRVNSAPLAAFEWAFDRESRRPVGISPVDPVESNLTTLIALLSAVGEPKSIEYIEPFTRSDRHFLRWEAARAIGAIDAEQGLATLRMLADDTHREVRSAARQSLERLCG